MLPYKYLPFHASVYSNIADAVYVCISNVLILLQQLSFVFQCLCVLPFPKCPLHNYAFETHIPTSVVVSCSNARYILFFYAILYHVIQCHIIAS